MLGLVLDINSLSSRPARKSLWPQIGPRIRGRATSRASKYSASFWALIGILASELSAATPPDPNAQLWTELDAVWHPGATTSITGAVYERTGEGFREPQLIAASVAVDVGIGSWRLSAGDLEVQVRSVSGASLEVNLPFASATLSWRAGPFVFSDRSRVEQLEGIRGSPLRLRNRLGGEIPVDGMGTLTGIELSDELFYDDARHQLTRNRAQVATVWTLGPRTTLLVYLLDQHNIGSSPHTLRVLGMTWRLRA